MPGSVAVHMSQRLHLCYAGALIGNFAASDSPDFQVRCCVTALHVCFVLLPLRCLCAALLWLLPMRIDDDEGLMTEEWDASPFSNVNA